MKQMSARYLKNLDFPTLRNWPAGPGWGGTQQGLAQSPAEGQEGGIISKPKKQAGTTLGTMGGGAEHPEINLHQRLPGSVLSHCFIANDFSKEIGNLLLCGEGYSACGLLCPGGSQGLLDHLCTHPQPRSREETSSTFSRSLNTATSFAGSEPGGRLSRGLLRERPPPLQLVLSILLLHLCLRLELQCWRMNVLVEMTQEGLTPSRQLMECSMPAYRSLSVALQMSSASEHGPLEKLLPPVPPCKEMPSPLGTRARPAELECKASPSLGNEVG
ncbi:hypothetical protein DBR06_SOUSAS1710177 [Sousa chinensis]|uniref:Uncharacterized protein n=1 Tax=Sousa chinensis TaxID=103600 RepID=A0A484GV69_SOUCH|nr:hypothetical protein DBR06_SOUSAS1710177 [Sousa chinensis]